MQAGVAQLKHGGIPRWLYIILGMFVIIALENFEQAVGIDSRDIRTWEIDDVAMHLLSAVFGFSLCGLRYKNMGYSPWMALLVLIPIINCFVYLFCLYPPPNYANTRKLDRAGNTINWILISLVCAFLLFVVVFVLREML